MFRHRKATCDHTFDTPVKLEIKHVLFLSSKTLLAKAKQSNMNAGNYPYNPRSVPPSSQRSVQQCEFP